MICRIVSFISISLTFAITANAQQADNKKQVRPEEVQQIATPQTITSGTVTAHPSKAVVPQEQMPADTASAVLPAAVTTTNQKRKPE